MERIASTVINGLLGCLLLCSAALAQTVPTAEISGTVTDSTGAVVPGVEIQVTQTETGSKASAMTNEKGFYVLPSLEIGPYHLQAKAPSFRPYARRGIVLEVRSHPVVDIPLELGPVTESVEVRANASLVEFRNTGISTVIDNQRINELPLNQRFPTDLIYLSGAALGVVAGGPWTMRTGASISVAGGLSFGVAYALDGASHSNLYDATGMPLPFPDTLAEFRVAASTQDAEQGVHSGASVNAVTKSGSNAFHGNLFEFVRNGMFNARNFFAASRDSLKRNQFGGTIGGPILKEKLFFFAGYQGTTIRSDPTNFTVFVPTAAMLAGDSTTFASAQCQGRDVTLGSPFNNNLLSTSDLSPAALKIASYLPKTSDPCGRILTGTPVSEDQGQYVGRLDYRPNTRQTFFARYVGTSVNAAIPYTLTKDVLTTNASGKDDFATSLALGHTYVASSNTVHSFRASFNRVAARHQGASFFGPEDVGIHAYSYLPHRMSMLVAPGFSFGNGLAADLTLFATMVGANDDVTMVRGSHEFAFGGNITHSLVDGLANAFSTGGYTFSGNATGLGLADFLTGQMNGSFSPSFQQAGPNGLIESHWLPGLYAQDTWKVTRRLTLNYGLRWEPFIPIQFKDGKVYSFSLDRFNQGVVSTVYRNAPPGFYFPGDPGFEGKAGVKKRWLDLQPRIGLAWDPLEDRRTAIRAGAGISYDFVAEQTFHNGVLPFTENTVRTGTVSLDNPWEGFPGGNPFPSAGDPAIAKFTPFGQYMPLSPDLRAPAVYNWNLGVQRQFTPSLFVSTSYIGTRTVHAWSLTELNPAVFKGLEPCTLNTSAGPVFYSRCSTPGNTDQRRRLSLQNPVAAQNIGSVSQWEPASSQNYHGLLVNAVLRQGRRLNINANYTWSHCIGEGGAWAGNFVPVAGLVLPHLDNPKLDRAPCFGGNADRRHILNLSPVVQTPMFANRGLRLVGTGWTLAVIYRYQTGAPVSIVSGFDDRALIGTNPIFQRAVQTSADVYASNKGGACGPNFPGCVSWLNPNAFVQPALGTLSDLGIGTALGPAYWRFDMALSRSFSISDRSRLELRAEAFNVLNGVRLLPPLPLPGFSLIGAPPFGGIHDADDPRIMQFAMKYVF